MEIFSRLSRRFDPLILVKGRILLLGFLFTSFATFSQESPLSPDELKNMSLEDLLNIEITSVSKQSEKLSETASAIQVVNSTDIQRYGATNLSEALYLASNLQVAQKGSHSYGISARGFNTELANKLLVMIDGRSIYTPLFSGVFWERQDYLLEDIQQIEVVSGPGGTIWGANAVNGVINIRTKDASETQGVYFQSAAGNKLRQLYSLRYGGNIGEDTHYRVYGKFSDREGMIFEDSVRAGDAWRMWQSGLKVDMNRTMNHLTFQGDVYGNQANLTFGKTSNTFGGNILGRWTHTFSDSSSIQLQGYFDRTDLRLPTAPFVINGTELAPEGKFKDKLNTYDLEFLHKLKGLGRNRIIWGAGYRFTDDKVANSPALGFLPERLKQSLYSIFIQDEINLSRNLFLIAGSKFEHNAYTGFVFEPSTRLRYNFGENKILWAAVSRAVRMPSRIDRDLTQGTPPYFVLLVGNSNFRTEKVIAYESGLRTTIGSKVSTSVSIFYNQYDDIRSTILNPETVFPLQFRNGLRGNTYGLEANVTIQLFEWWQLFSSYYLLREDLKVKKGETDFNNALNETGDPKWQYTVRSTFNLPFNLSINPAFRFIDNLTINNAGVATKVPAYAELDGSLSWLPKPFLQLSLFGRNLLHNQHVEYGIPGSREAIQRSLFLKLSLRF